LRATRFNPYRGQLEKKSILLVALLAFYAEAHALHTLRQQPTTQWHLRRWELQMDHFAAEAGVVAETEP
jgi:hypothetical protein